MEAQKVLPSQWRGVLTKHLRKKVKGVLSRKARELDPTFQDIPGRAKGSRWKPDIMTVVGLDQWQGKAKVGMGGSWKYPTAPA